MRDALSPLLKPVPSRCPRDGSGVGDRSRLSECWGGVSDPKTRGDPVIIKDAFSQAWPHFRSALCRAGERNGTGTGKTRGKGEREKEGERERKGGEGERRKKCWEAREGEHVAGRGRCAVPRVLSPLPSLVPPGGRGRAGAREGTDEAGRWPWGGLGPLLPSPSWAIPPPAPPPRSLQDHFQRKARGAEDFPPLAPFSFLPRARVRPYLLLFSPSARDKALIDTLFGDGRLAFLFWHQ